MANGDGNFDARAAMVDLLLQKVAEDTYPSGTMLDFIEELADPEELEAYAVVLMDKIRQDTYPSVPMMRRLVALLPQPR